MIIANDIAPYASYEPTIIMNISLRKQYSLLSLLCVTAVAAIGISIYRQIGFAGVPVTLALLSLVILVDNVLVGMGVKPTPFVSANPLSMFFVVSLLIHISVIWTVFPLAAELASDLSRQRYHRGMATGDYAPGATIEGIQWEEWAVYAQRDWLALLLAVIGYPATIIPITIGGVLSIRYDLRGAVWILLGCYLMLLPGFIAIFQIYRYV